MKSYRDTSMVISYRDIKYIDEIVSWYKYCGDIVSWHKYRDDIESWHKYRDDIVS